MAYGFTCINESGFYQIDGTLPQLMEVANGSATVSSYSDMVSGGGSRQQIISLSSVFGNRDIFIFIVDVIIVVVNHRMQSWKESTIVVIVLS